MLRLRILCGLVPGLLATAPLLAQTADSVAVRTVLERYLHGLKFNDTLALRDAFWPHARLYYARPDSSLGTWTQASWYASFAGQVGREAPGDLQVVALAITRDIATATIVEDYPRSRYTDYVSLLRIRGRWWIMNKLYTAERRQPG